MGKLSDLPYTWAKACLTVHITMHKTAKSPTDLRCELGMPNNVASTMSHVVKLPSFCITDCTSSWQKPSKLLTDLQAELGFSDVECIASHVVELTNICNFIK